MASTSPVTPIPPAQQSRSRGRLALTLGLGFVIAIIGRPDARCVDQRWIAPARGDCLRRACRRRSAPDPARAGQRRRRGVGGRRARGRDTLSHLTRPQHAAPQAPPRVWHDGGEAGPGSSDYAGYGYGPGHGHAYRARTQLCRRYPAAHVRRVPGYGRRAYAGEAVRGERRPRGSPRPGSRRQSTVGPRFSAAERTHR